MAIIWGTQLLRSSRARSRARSAGVQRRAHDVASLAFLLVMGAARLLPAARAGGPQAPASSIFRSAAPLTVRDWLRLAVLGVVGHVLYQFLFIGGLARTSVANSSLMLATTPVLDRDRQRGARLRANRPDALARRGGLDGGDLSGRRPRVRARRRSAGRRSDDVRRRLLLGDLHARRAAADGAALAGRRHRPVDGARHAGLRRRWSGRRCVPWTGSRVSGLDARPAGLLGAVRAVRVLHDLVRRASARSAARGRPPTRT